MNSKLENRLKEITYALKEKGQTGRSFHTTFILKKSKILSIGVNNYNKSHPRILGYNYHEGAKIHSEMAAILKMGITDFSGLSIVNFRINNLGFVDNSKYCSGCSELVKNLGFKNAFFSNNCGQVEEFELES